ncbi:hypothetical protein C475_00932 [Halosimplex carlsbadense 2-9-1]|uniref:Uncharacterized protein n=1 Tax=Halosimplex carlsbadense 2-9-1 TaxID=797114 RepID=M0D482_9EURY|nr:hypothetical protein [Halosimplex carlsbadense]ELZ30255.1 hypothetical protein C475_00932 [Halosimplex carlsbadense 2-9-1]
MPSIVEAVDGGIMARYESDSAVFEVTFETLRVNDVTLHFERDGEKVGSIYNDDGTERTMARLVTSGEDFIGVEVPKSFVAEILAVAEDRDRAADGRSTPERYRLRVLDTDATGAE